MVRAGRALREKMFALERLENGTGVFGPEAEQPSHLRHADGEARHVEELVSYAERILIDWITWDDHRHTSEMRGLPAICRGPANVDWIDCGPHKENVKREDVQRQLNRSTN
jgi:hypothetical protein